MLSAIEVAVETHRRTPSTTIRVLDPFAGVGGIHALADSTTETVGVEIEPEWAAAHPGTIVGDARSLPFDDRSFDVVATSPAYGNRMADSYDGRDGSRRMTYRISLGRPLTAGNGGALHWGPDYQALHSAAWSEAERVLAPGGSMLVNVSNHIRKGREVQVAEWHLQTLLSLGLYLVEAHRIETPRMGFGANHSARAACEFLLSFRKGCDR